MNPNQNHFVSNSFNTQQVKIENFSDNEFQDDYDKISLGKQPWGNLQKTRYLMFLIRYQQYLEDRTFNDKFCRYQKMAIYIYGEPNFNCKKYHSIYLKKFQSIQGTIDYLKENIYFNLENLKKQVARFKSIEQTFKQKMIKSLETSPANSQNFLSLRASKIEIVEGSQDLRAKIKEEIEKFRTQGSDLKQIQIQVPQNTFLRVQLVPISKNSVYKSQYQKMNQTIKSFENDKLKLKLKRGRINRKSKGIKKVNKKKRIKKKILNKISNFQLGNDQKAPKLVKDKNGESMSKKKKKKTWTKTQNIKALIFLHVNRSKYETIDIEKRQKFFHQLSQYINTNKSPYDCKKRIYKLCRKLNNSLQNMIRQETKRFEIFPALIEIQRKKLKLLQEKYNSQKEIKFENLKIEFQNLKQELNMDSLQGQNIKANFEIEIFVKIQKHDQQVVKQKRPNTENFQKQQFYQQQHQKQIHSLMKKYEKK